MQIHISPNDGPPIYLQIVNQVKYLAASGRLTAATGRPTMGQFIDPKTGVVQPPRMPTPEHPFYPPEPQPPGFPGALPEMRGPVMDRPIMDRPTAAPPSFPEGPRGIRTSPTSNSTRVGRLLLHESQPGHGFSDRLRRCGWP